MNNLEYIKDFIDLDKLPIQGIRNLGYFEYALERLGKLQEWIEFLRIQEEKFGGDHGRYKDYYWETKEAFLKYTKSLPEYQAFQNRDLKEFGFQFPQGVSKGNQYTENNTGRVLLSIDLKKANYQALKYCGVFGDTSTYEDLISKFTDLPFLVKSKYLRSVVFGQLNPGRHITIESWLMNTLVRPEISDQLKLVCMASDELIYEVPGDLEYNLDETRETIQANTGLSVTAEIYRLHEYILEAEISGKQYQIYGKENLETGKIEYKCIPSNLYLMFSKLITSSSLCDYDKWIEHDGVLAEYMEDFKVYEKERGR